MGDPEEFGLEERVVAVEDPAAIEAEVDVDPANLEMIGHVGSGDVGGGVGIVGIREWDEKMLSPRLDGQNPAPVEEFGAGREPTLRGRCAHDLTGKEFGENEGKAMNGVSFWHGSRLPPVKLGWAGAGAGACE